MKENDIDRGVVFAIDEEKAGFSYEHTNNRVLRVISENSNLIGFARLDPRAGERASCEFRRCVRAGMRGVKLHPRSEKFYPQAAEELIAEIEKEDLPILLHTSHEENCRPLSWSPVFRRHPKVPFILAHGAKDAFQEAIAVAEKNRNVWLETSTLSYWRTGVILKSLGASRVVFGSDLPYSHPAVERLKLDLLLSPSGRRRVYSENPKKILGE